MTTERTVKSVTVDGESVSYASQQEEVIKDRRDGEASAKANNTAWPFRFRFMRGFTRDSD